MNDSNQKHPQFEEFLALNSTFGKVTAEALNLYFQQENESETELVNVYLDTFQKVFANIGTELRQHFTEVDDETQSIIARHIENSDINNLMRSSNNLLAKKSKILGIIEKILPILEIIKKVIDQILDIFPNFLSKFLRKIIVPLLEILDNIGKRILDLFNIEKASFYLRSAEQDFLDTHPKWRKLQFAND